MILHLNTSRLELRLLTPEVYRHVFTCYSTEEQKTFFGYTSMEELDLEHRKYTEGMQMFNKSFANFQLIEKKTGAVIGKCGYHTWYLSHFRAELGYVLPDPANRGKGFMKEALPPVLEYGFDALRLRRIEAFIGPDNYPSLHLLRAFGFQHEGLLREHYFTNGRMENSFVFSLLKNTYPDQIL